MRGRRNERPSRVATALFFFGLVTVFSIITVLLFGTPGSPKELAMTLAIVMVANAVWLPVALVWERIMEKRRRNRLGG